FSRQTLTVIDQTRIVARISREVGMGDHPVIGYVVWAVLFGAMFAWEGLALSHFSGSVPTLSAAFRAIMRYPSGRWALFALWLWVGWHVFVRGWHFLLRAGPRSPPPRPAALAGGPDMSAALVRGDIGPMVAGYVLVMGALAVGLLLI